MTEWISDHPTNCDLCKIPIKKVFIDGRFRPPGFDFYVSTWAYLCEECHAEVGVGLGTGQGQKYVKTEDNKFMKVEG